MFVAVADTHAALWYLGADARLSSLAKTFINSVVETYSDIAISSITLVEIVYLIEKKRLHPSVYESLSDALNDAEHCFTEATVTSPDHQP